VIVFNSRFAPDGKRIYVATDAGGEQAILLALDRAARARSLHRGHPATAEIEDVVVAGPAIIAMPGAATPPAACWTASSAGVQSSIGSGRGSFEDGAADGGPMAPDSWQSLCHRRRDQ
jgi:hypothetical protein